MAFRPAVFDRQGLSLDLAGVGQSLTERGESRQCRAFGRPWCEVADYRHRLLLRAGGKRPCNRPAEKNKEIAPVQSFTLSWAIGPTNLSHSTFSYQGSAKIAGGIGPSMTACRRGHHRPGKSGRSPSHPTPQLAVVILNGAYRQYSGHQAGRAGAAHADPEPTFMA